MFLLHPPMNLSLFCWRDKRVLFSPSAHAQPQLNQPTKNGNLMRSFVSKMCPVSRAARAGERVLLGGGCSCRCGTGHSRHHAEKGNGFGNRWVNGRHGSASWSWNWKLAVPSASDLMLVRLALLLYWTTGLRKYSAWRTGTPWCAIATPVAVLIGRFPFRCFGFLAPWLLGYFVLFVMKTCLNDMAYLFGYRTILAT